MSAPFLFLLTWRLGNHMTSVCLYFLTCCLQCALRYHLPWSPSCLRPSTTQLSFRFCFRSRRTFSPDLFPEEFMPNLIVPRYSYKSCISFCSVFSDIKMTIVRVKKMKLSAPTFYQIQLFLIGSEFIFHENIICNSFLNFVLVLKVIFVSQVKKSCHMVLDILLPY